MAHANLRRELAALANLVDRWLGLALGLTCAGIVTVACSASTSGVPSATDDGWPVSAAQAEGLDAGGLAAVIQYLDRDPHGDFRSLIVARNGRLVLEAYFNGHSRDSLHDIRSATKSITTALVGIAIADGLIADVRAKVLPSLTHHTQSANVDPLTYSITVENLLTMTSGLDANDEDATSAGNEDRLSESQDWLRFALELPMAHEPGQDWAYASVNTFLLGAIIEEASGKRLKEFAAEQLFGPLGISQFHWRSAPSGQTVGQGNLSIRAHDMAKFGQLYLDGGQWADKQVIPMQWVEASITGRYPVPWHGYDAYGYGWYLHTLVVEGRPFRYFFASGNGGNKIYVLPDHHMVIAVQSAAYDTNYGQRRSLDVLRRVLGTVSDRQDVRANALRF